MNELKRALLPVKRRMRLGRTLLWVSYGVFAAAICVVLLRAAAFLWLFPSARRWALGAAVLIPSLFALVAWLWPITELDAARQADSLGLEARAQTAVMLHTCDTPMANLQREDALERLHALQPRREMALRLPHLSLIGTLVCTLLVGMSYLIPNPQAAALRERAAFRAEMKAQAQKVDEGAAALNADEAETPEVRRLLGELSQTLRKSEETREALSAVDAAERKLTQMQTSTAKAAMHALRATGLGSLANALEQNDRDAALKALEDTQGELAQAARMADVQTAAQLLSAAASAMQNGDTDQALQKLENAVQGQSAPCAQGMALAAMVRSAAVRASCQSASPSMQGMGMLGSNGGQGTSAGKNSLATQGSGSGAGSGSSDKDGGISTPSAARSAASGSPPTQRTAEYEPIYDPTRLGTSGDRVSERGRMGQGEITEMELGTGLGTTDGSVPYAQVLPQYSRVAVEAAQNADLPAYAQKWVETYFDSLKE